MPAIGHEPAPQTDPAILTNFMPITGCIARNLRGVQVVPDPAGYRSNHPETVIVDRSGRVCQGGELRGATSPGPVAIVRKRPRRRVENNLWRRTRCRTHRERRRRKLSARVGRQPGEYGARQLDAVVCCAEVCDCIDVVSAGNCRRECKGVATSAPGKGIVS